MYIQDTIAAISTPHGMGGIGIVRVSGSQAHRIGKQLFRFHRGGDFTSHFLHYGTIIDPSTGNLLDEAMAVLMKAPSSYTCEDVLELHCHGGLVVVETVLATVLQSGARLAEAGEFTRRAFLNGRIDLLKAEAVMDVISSRSEASLSLAMRQQEGALSRRIIDLRELLLHAAALVEAYIDFPEEDLGATDLTAISANIAAANDIVSQLLENYEEGRIVRDGIAVLIVGKPNAGKSSLLNALLGEERAIVTHIAGTTRDIIEETTNVGGLAIRLLDTAGIRATDDLVEQQGIGRAMDCIPLADLVLFVLDRSRGIDSEDSLILKALEGKKVLLVANKTDLVDQLSLSDEWQQLPCFPVSTKTGAGIEQLKLALRAAFVRDGVLDSREFVAISRARHRDALVSAQTLLGRCTDALSLGAELETLSIDLREALSVVGTVTGETTPDDILDLIFSSFCIGK